eukprot:437230-Pelagomonas_calceolata.AAC.4
MSTPAGQGHVHTHQIHPLVHMGALQQGQAHTCNQPARGLYRPSCKPFVSLVSKVALSRSSLAASKSSTEPKNKRGRKRKQGMPLHKCQNVQCSLLNNAMAFHIHPAYLRKGTRIQTCTFNTRRVHSCSLHNSSQTITDMSQMRVCTEGEQMQKLMPACRTVGA